MESWNISWTGPQKDILSCLPRHWQLEQYWNQVENKFVDLITGKIVNLDDEPDFVQTHLQLESKML